MSFNYRETQIIKGMLARGDRQHDIAAFFGVNGGRIGEVSTGDCDYPSAEPLEAAELPPKPAYPSPYATLRAKEMIQDLVKVVSMEADAAIAKKICDRRALENCR